MKWWEGFLIIIALLVVSSLLKKVSKGKQGFFWKIVSVLGSLFEWVLWFVP